MNAANQPKRFLLQQMKFMPVFLLLIPMLVDCNENVALLNCCIRFVEHQRGEYILNKTLYV